MEAGIQPVSIAEGREEGAQDESGQQQERQGNPEEEHELHRRLAAAERMGWDQLARGLPPGGIACGAALPLSF